MNKFLKSIISAVHLPDIPCDYPSRYSVLNRNIPEVSIKLESVQEEQDTPLVESYNQQ